MQRAFTGYWLQAVQSVVMSSSEEDRSIYGAVFEHQRAARGTDFFAVLGISPKDVLTQEAILAAYRTALRHVFEGSGLAATKGPNVPTWVQLNPPTPDF